MQMNEYPVMPAYEPSLAYRAPENRPATVMSRKMNYTRKTIKKEISNFFTETSFTALSRIYKAQSVFRRLAWATVVVAMMVWLGIQCFWLLDKFFRYPIEVKLDLKASTALEFPSVTICNMNPVVKGKLSTPIFEELRKYTEPNLKDSLYASALHNWVFEESDMQCREHDFDCGNNRCIPPKLLCNGKNDCSNNLDEKNCEDHTCKEGYFKCSDFTCKRITVRCNGKKDCLSGNDEEDCFDEVTCPANYAACATGGQCIFNSWWCDGFLDCKDHSDEHLNCTETLANSTQSTPTINVTETTEENNEAGQFGPHTTQSPNHRADKGTTRPARSTSSKEKKTPPNREKRDALDIRQNDNGLQTNETDDTTQRSKFRNIILKRGHSLQTNMDETEMFRALDKSVQQNFNRELRGKAEGQKEQIHLRQRRQTKEPRSKEAEDSDESEYAIDWDTILQNSDFSKWDSLGTDAHASQSYHAQRDDEWAASMTYAYITAGQNATVLEKSGHKKRNFIAACEFNGFKCSPANFTFMHNHKYGNCYTFNSKFSNSPSLTTRYPGPEYGLKLQLFINQKAYVANLATEAGARVVIHKRGSMAFPEDNGISIMPGRSTSIGINQVRLSRLPSPHGSCANIGRITDCYHKYKDTDYSKLSCLKSCYQDVIIETCGCAVPFYLVLPDTPVCDMLNETIEECVCELYGTSAGKFEECDNKCPQPCLETDYRLSISSSVWPSKDYQKYLTKKLAQTNSRYININIHEDFTKVQIYYQDLIYTHIDQAKAYESMNLISDLGGQLGLWLGLSAITIGELCTFLFSVGRSLSSTWCGGSETSPNEAATSSSTLPISLDDIYDDMYPEAATYIPPDVSNFKKKLRNKTSSNSNA